MIYNGVEIEVMTFNGNKVETWIHNGVEVFSGFEPFYWIKDAVVQDGYPSSYATVTQSNTETWLTDTTITNMCGRGTDNWTITGTTIEVDTQGNKFVDIGQLYFTVHIYVWYEIIGVVDGTETIIGRYTTATSNIPISGYDSIKLRTQCGNWATNWGYARIKSIYFHS